MSAPSDAKLLAAVTPGVAARLRNAALWLGTAALIGCSLWRIGFNPFDVIAGVGQLGWLLTKMFPPLTGGYLASYCEALLETLAMALLGAALASGAAFPLSLLGSRLVSPSNWVRLAVRRLFDLLRGIDTLIWALIFVSATGLGPFAGVMALAVSETGVLGKLFSDALDDTDLPVAASVRASGANRLQTLRFGILPQSLPVMADQSLYYFESNVRSATILGVVGAGGIGFELADRIRVNEWQQVGFLILLILAAVAVIDAASSWISRRLIHGKR